MRAVENLPDDYKEIYAVNLQKNKKMAVIVNLIAVAIAVIMAVPMHFVVPFFSVFSM